MKVFLTGATGFIGSRIVPELLKAGHEVIGLTRSEKGAAELEAAGATAHRGDIEQLDTIRSGAEKADGVIHCAFDHDFSNFVANCEKDRRVIETLGAVFKGSNRPILITSGVGLGAPAEGGLALEKNFSADYPNPRKLSEVTANKLVDEGVNVSSMRLPQVHDTEKQGLLTPLIEILREKGVSAYIGDGTKGMSAAHVSDVALLYVLALERAQAGARYNAVAEEGVPMREIAETLGRGLKIPVKSVAADEAQEYFGWMGMFMGMDFSASGAWTQKELNWHPTGPGLIADLHGTTY